VELRARRLAGLIGLALAAVAVLVGAAPADAAERLTRPVITTQAPAGYRLTPVEAIELADRTAEVREERSRRSPLAATAFTSGAGRWQVSYFEGPRERAQVIVDDRLGAVTEAWTGAQVSWRMARGYEGAFGRTLNAPWVWLPLCVVFLLPFVDPRRPFRLLHLDLLVLLAFGVSHVFFNRGEIGASVPLVYPVLLYLLARMLIAGFRPHHRREPLVPFASARWLMVGLVFLVAFRVGLNVIDSSVIDVGYAGVIGADRVADGEQLYDGRFPESNDRGDTYGPVNYLAYLPFEQALPWGGSWDSLPAAHAAAVAFDLLTLVGLLLLGRRLRPGREGRLLGLALGFAWAAYPYSLFALASNANDSLVAMLVVFALLAVTSAPGRGALVGLAGAAKLAPFALAPLFIAGERRLGRSALVAAAAFAVVVALSFLPFVPDGGLRQVYDRTLGFQTGRHSPFSIWGQQPGLEWLHTVVKVAAVGLALLVAVVPRRRTPAQVAALGAAVLIALQLAATHWFYLYVAWFAPLVLVALFAAYRTDEGKGPGDEAHSEKPVPAPAVS
jgi:hypothetical protein